MQLTSALTANPTRYVTGRDDRSLLADRSLRRRTVWFAFYTVGCAALFWHPLRDLVYLAKSSDTDSHVLLIPFVTVSLLWAFRKVIFQQTCPNSRVFAAAFLLLGVLVYLSRWHFGPILPTRYSLELMVVSFCSFFFAGFVLMYGMESFRAGLFPLLFLLLSVPLPEFLLNRLIWWLQLGSAEVSSWIFYLTRTPVLREGLLFTVPGVTIEIAKECSGIRSTIGLLITCMLAGYLLLRTVSARVALLVAALPVLAVKNGIRIATLTLLSIHVDPGFLVGRLHRDGGFVFFAIGLLILLPVLSWLRRAEDQYLGARKSGANAMFGTTHVCNGKSR